MMKTFVEGFQEPKKPIQEFRIKSRNSPRMVSLTNAFLSVPGRLSDDKQNIQFLQRFDTRCTTILDLGNDYNTHVGKKKQFYFR